ncbi:MAG TPA: sulfurtransferase TusA family protein [bacterium]|nr:sulfurtransferase TusA family protein [bacterium]
MDTDYTIDTVGKFCPVPIIEAANRIKEMNVGETLTVISDDPGIKSDMPNWCSITGNEFLGETEDDEVFKVYVKKVVS